MGLLYSNYEANPITNNNIRFNSVSGTLVKTFRKSYFVTCKFGSYLAQGLFDEDKPNLGYEYNFRYCNGREVVVLQIMLCSEDRLLIEVINKDDYEEMFKIETNNCKMLELKE